MAIIGALVRVDETQRDAARQNLARLPGVTPFDLDQATRLGLVIEVASLDDAYHLLNDRIGKVSGVVNVNPVYAHFESGL